MEILELFVYIYNNDLGNKAASNHNHDSAYQAKGNYSKISAYSVGTGNSNFLVNTNKAYIVLMAGGGEIYLFIAAYLSGGLRIYDIKKSTTHFSIATSGTTLGLYRNNTASLISIVDITQ